MKKFYFLCPDHQQASGGVAVIYDIVAALVKKGVLASVLHGTPSGGFKNYTVPVPSVYSNRYHIARMRFDGRLARVFTPLRLVGEALRGGPLKAARFSDADCVVVPDFMCAAAMTAFPRQRLVVLVQNQLAFRDAHVEGLKQGLDIRDRADYFIGVSQSCFDEFDLMGLRNTLYLRVSMKPEEFPFRERKEKVIVYMPRKRLSEADIVFEALHRRGKLKGYGLQALDNLPRESISQSLQRSMFFLSLQRNESIGFPAAEAMASGCIVVGYTGLGGREYFTNKTGVPVVEDDTLALVKALEETVAEYSEKPERLDAIRRSASRQINIQYSWTQFENSLSQIWQVVDSK